MRLPALAATLKAIAARARAPSTKAPIADDMVATLAARGSFLTAEDFASHRGDVVDADLDQLSRPRSASNCRRTGRASPRW